MVCCLCRLLTCPRGYLNLDIIPFLVPESLFSRAKASVYRQINRLLCCLKKGFQRIFTRFERLEAILPGLMLFVDKVRFGVSTS